MIHYKDRTFCASPGCKNKCGRILTAEDGAKAKRMGLPISQAWYCDENGELIPDDYDPQPPPLPSGDEKERQ